GERNLGRWSAVHVNEQRTRTAVTRSTDRGIEDAPRDRAALGSPGDHFGRREGRGIGDPDSVGRARRLFAVLGAGHEGWGLEGRRAHVHERVSSDLESYEIGVCAWKLRDLAPGNRDAKKRVPTLTASHRVDRGRGRVPSISVAGWEPVREPDLPLA